jgi:hypothetical protein
LNELFLVQIILSVFIVHCYFIKMYYLKVLAGKSLQQKDRRVRIGKSKRQRVLPKILISIHFCNIIGRWFISAKIKSVRNSTLCESPYQFRSTQDYTDSVEKGQLGIISKKNSGLLPTSSESVNCVKNDSSLDLIENNSDWELDVFPESDSELDLVDNNKSLNMTFTKPMAISTQIPTFSTSSSDGDTTNREIYNKRRERKRWENRSRQKNERNSRFVDRDSRKGLSDSRSYSVSRKKYY